MRIVIAGGTGFLGTALSRDLMDAGHDVVVLSRGTGAPPARNPGAAGKASRVPWNPDGGTGDWAHVLEGANAVVNLAGESIAGKRWTVKQKDKILMTRLRATRSLVSGLRNCRQKPPVFVSGSAVGYYGDRGEETLPETSKPGDDFLAGVCREWEAAAAEATPFSRVAIVRTGIVLDRRGGALPKMLPPFFLFAGGPLGSGRQYMAWIHIADWTRLVSWIILSEGARGPVNATAPSPVSNAEFSKALGEAMHRPSLLPAPAFALRIILGEMADALLLSGQRALPVRASDLGFSFQFGNVGDALADIFKRHSRL
jgi:uncharacterized protein (TIGR01777 family)